MRNGLVAIAIIACCHISTLAFAQLEYANWNFGNNCGVSFVSGSPVNFSGSAISTVEGTSSMSDAAGNLLFYTDGTYVYNANNAMMPNGTGLLGNISSTQSALIVKDPAAPELYYIFTAGVQGSADGLCYSKVDMTLDGGLGDVTQLNVLLVGYTDEKVIGTLNASGDGYWIITRKAPNEFHAFPVSSSGVGAAVVSYGASTSDASIGYLKISPDGSHIASAHHMGYEWEMADFNNVTGQLSNFFSLPDGSSSYAYGCEFSESGNVLYLSSYANLYQLDMTAGSSAAILASAQIIFSGGTVTFPGALQRAIDGKIYRAQYSFNFLGIINDPEILGTGCNFVEQGFNLNNQCMLGLPNTLSSLDIAIAGLNIDGDLEICLGDSTILTASGDSLVWWSTLTNPTVEIDGDSILIISPSVTTSYIAHSANAADTATVVVSMPPSVILGNDLVICNGASQNLNAFCDSCIYSWSNGSTNASISVNAAGNYSVTVTNAAGCSASDSVDITTDALSVTLGNDTSFCEGLSVTLFAEATAPVSYLWQDGSTDSSLVASTTSAYSVTVTNVNQCTASDVVNVNVVTIDTDLGDDKTICESQQVVLDAGAGFDIYSWSDGSASQTLAATESGRYSVTVTWLGCVDSGSVDVTVFPYPVVNLGSDTNLCHSQEVNLNAGNDGYLFLWSNGATDQNITVRTPDVYSVTVNNNGCIDTDSILVTFVSCDVYIPNAFSPNFDGLNDVFRAVYLWKPIVFELVVYNRWGQVVYSGSDPAKGWNGTLKDADCEIGVYVWRCKYQTVGEVRYIQGNLTLMR